MDHNLAYLLGAILIVFGTPLAGVVVLVIVEVVKAAFTFTKQEDGDGVTK